MTSGAAICRSASSTVKPANAFSRADCSPSSPIEAHTSVERRCARAPPPSGCARLDVGAPVAVLARARQHRGVGIVAFGTGEREIEPEDGGGLDPRMGHVVAVADPGEARAARLERAGAEPLPDGEQIGEHLTRVRQIGEAVDHRHRREARQLLGDVVPEGADDDGVAVAAEHARGVAQRLAAADLRALRGEIDGVAAELVHADLEADARARRGLLEDHPERLADERLMQLRRAGACA